VSVALTMEGGNRWQWRLKDGEGGGGSVTGADKLLEGGWGRLPRARIQEGYCKERLTT
jgi:hypothetical protein